MCVILPGVRLRIALAEQDVRGLMWSKLHEPLAAIKPQFFVLEQGFGW